MAPKQGTVVCGVCEGGKDGLQRHTFMPLLPASCMIGRRFGSMHPHSCVALPLVLIRLQYATWFAGRQPTLARR